MTSSTSLSTSYLGFDLPHPVMPGASPLTGEVDGVRRLEDAGAAALVLPSLFEEEIRGAPAPGTPSPPAAASSRGPEEYLELVAGVRKAVAVPVIGSLNGTTGGGWIEYARLIETAGADALELNVYELPTDPYESSAAVERRLREMVTRVKQAVTIPVAVKLSPYHTSLVNFARRLGAAGADGLTLFNRVYQVDLDVDERRVESRLRLSDPSDLPIRLRWAAILADRFPGSLAVSGGVHTAVDAVKAVLCGAHAVQMVSALLAGGPEVLTRTVDDLARWLEEQGCGSLAQLRGALSYERSPSPRVWERAQYVETLQRWKERPG